MKRRRQRRDQREEEKFCHAFSVDSQWRTGDSTEKEREFVPYPLKLTSLTFNLVRLSDNVLPLSPPRKSKKTQLLRVEQLQIFLKPPWELIPGAGHNSILKKI